MHVIILSIVGLAVGCASSFFGIGGGVLIVPTLTYLFPEVSDVNIIATSIATIFIAASINSYSFYKKRLWPNRKVVITTLAGCLIGSFTGSLLLPYIPSLYLKSLFAALLLIMGLKSLFSTSPPVSQDKSHHLISLGFIISLCGSLLSSLTGLGGGIIFVPLYLYLMKVSVKKVSIYSNMAMLFATFFGILPHLSYSHMETLYRPYTTFASLLVGSISFEVVLTMFIGMKVGSYFGNKINDKVSTSKKNLLLSLLMIAVALKTFLQLFS